MDTEANLSKQRTSRNIPKETRKTREDKANFRQSYENDYTELKRADLFNGDAPSKPSPTHILVTTHECSYDLWSALSMGIGALKGSYPRVRSGESSSLINGEHIELEKNGFGGSLFAYELPTAQLDDPIPAGSSKRNILSDNERIDPSGCNEHESPAIPLQKQNSVTQSDSTYVPWRRHTLFRGFRVRGWGGIFSPGAPGFPYVFKFPNQSNVSRDAYHRFLF
jgi:hypothetical protein